MPMRLGIIIGIFLTATGSVHSGQQHPQEAASAKVYSVCEVLEQRKALDGMMVAVRGVIVGGGHGSFLSGSCSSHFTTKGFTWPDVIWLTNPRTPKGQLFEVDVEAHKRVQKAIKRLPLARATR
jgi:hypothetical protein